MSRSTSHLYEPPGGKGLPAWRTFAADQMRYAFDREGVRAIDREAVEQYGIPSILLMENAARGLLHQAMTMLQHDADPRVLIICGSGNNGGDGLALARHLHNRNINLAFALLGEPRAETDAAVNLLICRRMGLREVAIDDLDRFARSASISLVVDAIFGTGLDRPITGRAAAIIHWLNALGRPVLAVDLPSGLDCDTGSILGAAVKADRTVTFVGPKIGFTSLDAQKLLGEVVVADIGAPRELIERYGQRFESPHPEVPDHEPIAAGHSRRPGQ